MGVVPARLAQSRAGTLAGVVQRSSQALPAPGFMVCTRNWALGGLPAQPLPVCATNIDAVESGG
jgi:hypothetical protein